MRVLADNKLPDGNGDIVIGFTPDEFAQALVDLAVKRGLVPEDRRLDPVIHEFVNGDNETPHRLTVMLPGQQIGFRGVTQRRKEPT